MELKEFLKDYGVLCTAGATFLATLVALFKDGFYSWYNRPILKFIKEDCHFFPHYNESSSDIPSQEIDSYIYQIKLKNTGRSVCKKIQMYLEDITFKGSKDAKFYSIKIQNEEPVLCAKKISTLDMTQFSRPVLFEVVKILKPNSENRSNDEKGCDKARIQIGNYLLPIDKTGGEYRIFFNIYSENHEKKKINISLNWKGVWMPSEKDFFDRGIECKLEGK